MSVVLLLKKESGVLFWQQSKLLTAQILRLNTFYLVKNNGRMSFILFFHIQNYKELKRYRR
jgi:hypothetical protein